MINKITNRIKRELKLNTKEIYVNKVVQDKLTYLSKKALYLILSAISELEKSKIEGDFIETGCALGGSSILIAKFKKEKRNFYVYDSFEMMPEPGEKDGADVHERYSVIKSGESKGIKGDPYYGYEKDLLGKVKNNFSNYNINPDNQNIYFVKGYYEDTLIINKPVAFAHIDCDWYDSVLVSLERIVPFLVIGGVLIIDDYYCYSGCKNATDEYFKDKLDSFTFIEGERLMIKRKS